MERVTWELGRGSQEGILIFWRELPRDHVGPQFQDHRSKPHPLHWKHGVLTTGLPGSPQEVLLG